MALQAGVLHLAAGVALNENTRPEHLQPGSANVRAENVRGVDRGGLRKRPGFTALSAGLLSGTRTTGTRHFAHEQQICVAATYADGPRLDVYAPDAGVSNSLTRLPDVAFTTRATTSIGLANNAASVLTDCAYNGGYVATVQSISTKVWVTIEDASTGTVVRRSEALYASAVGDVFGALGTCGAHFILLVRDSANASISALHIDTSSASTLAGGWIQLTPVATNATTTGTASLALSVHSFSGSVVFAYVNNSAGVFQLTVKAMTFAGVTDSVDINTSSVKPVACALHGQSADVLWVVWNETTAIKARGLNPASISATALAATGTIITTTSTISAATAIEVVSGTTDRVSGSTVNTACVIASDGDGLRVHRYDVYNAAGNAAVTGVYRVIPNVRRLSRCFVANGNVYCVFGGPSTAYADQGMAALCNLTTRDDTVEGNVPTIGLPSMARPVACLSPTLAYGLWPNVHLSQSTATKWLWPMTITRSSVAAGAVMVTLDMKAADRWQTIRHGNTTFLTGGMLSYFDGVRVAEQGFLHRPPVPTTTNAGTGITGTFIYIAVYEEVDANGNWCQSGIGDPSAPVTVANKTITVKVAPCALSARLFEGTTVNSRVRIALYRTTDTGAGDVIYYRVGEVINDTSLAAGVVSFTDAVTDTTLATKQKLYVPVPGAVGSPLDRRPAGAAYLACSYNGMLVTAFGPNLTNSAQYVSGEEVWTNPVFVTPVPGSGDVSALAAIDGALYAFKRRSVYAIGGDSPSDNGSSGGLGEPRRLAVDSGAVSPYTCVTSLGVFFVSDRGIELLSRGQTVDWIGEPVSTTFAAYPNCRGIHLDASGQHVYVELASATSLDQATGTGRTLVFDLTMKAWISTDRRKNSAGTADCPAQSATVVYTGSAYRYSWLDANGVVHVEDTTTCLDAGAWATMLWEPAPLKQGLQQEQHLWRGLLMAEQHSAAGLLVECAIDWKAYGAIASDTKAWTEAAALSQLQFPFEPTSSMQVLKTRISDTAPAVLGTGEGFRFIGASFDIAPKQGSTRGTPQVDVSLRR